MASQRPHILKDGGREVQNLQDKALEVGRGAERERERRMCLDAEMNLPPVSSYTHLLLHQTTSLTAHFKMWPHPKGPRKGDVVRSYMGANSRSCEKFGSMERDYYGTVTRSLQCFININLPRFDKQEVKPEGIGSVAPTSFQNGSYDNEMWHPHAKIRRRDSNET